MPNSIQSRRHVALTILSQTAFAVAIGLPATFAFTYWRFGGDLS